MNPSLKTAAGVGRHSVPQTELVPNRGASPDRFCHAPLTRTPQERRVPGRGLCAWVSVALFVHYGGPIARAKPSESPRNNATIRLPLIEGKDIRFTHFTTAAGLSQGRVENMLRDRQGFMWFGTFNGLNRFDGFRFRVYRPEANNPNSLGGVYISTALFEDRLAASGLESIRAWTDSTPSQRSSPTSTPIPPIRRP